MLRKPAATIALLLVGVPLLLEARVGIQRPAWIDTEQTLTIQYGVWEPRPGALSVTERIRIPGAGLLLEQDRQLLLQSLKTGRVSIAASDATRISPIPSARMIVLLTGRLKATATLQQPDAATILYVQEGDGFRRYPPTARLSSLTLEIGPVVGRPDLYHVFFDHPLGGRSGGEKVIRR